MSIFEYTPLLVYTLFNLKLHVPVLCIGVYTLFKLHVPVLYIGVNTFI